MIKKFLALIKTSIIVIIFLSSKNIIAQDLTFTIHDSIKTAVLGTEIIFSMKIKNVSLINQTAFVVRTKNQLPNNWQSSLCFDACFPPNIDSIATSTDFGSTPLTPGEEREVSIHVFTQTNIGTAILQIQAGNTRTPNVRFIVNLVAIAVLTDLNNENISSDFSLEQNYPNPFSAGSISALNENQKSKIKYQIGERSLVSLKIFDLLGKEVAVLVNSEQEKGTYIVVLDASSLAASIKNKGGVSSAVYFYRINIQNSKQSFSKVKKMILLE